MAQNIANTKYLSSLRSIKLTEARKQIPEVRKSVLLLENIYGTSVKSDPNVLLKNPYSSDFSGGVSFGREYIYLGDNFSFRMQESRQQQSFYILLKALNINYTGIQGEQLEPDLRKLDIQLNKGEISAMQYFDGNIKFYTTCGNYFNDQLKQKATALNNLSADKMIFWNNLKNACNAIRIAAIIPLVGAYLMLFMMIKRRIK